VTCIGIFHGENLKDAVSPFLLS